MIICRTPYRISFFGGGTDYPAWYEENGGLVISATINKYSYITCRYLPPFFEYKYRIRYYQREEVSAIDHIQHPSVRECIRFLDIDRGLDIVHHGDLPAQSGLGTSSTFTVGLLHSLSALTHQMWTKRQLALHAINIEQKKIGESVGSQDQVAAAFGGLNLIEFDSVKEMTVTPILLSSAKLKMLESQIMLFFTGFSRTASHLAAEQIRKIPENKKKLFEMMQLVNEATSILRHSDDNFEDFGRLLNHQWILKRSISKDITSDDIDFIYQAGIKAGAIGGKLLGAGAGGFIMFIVKPEHQNNVKQTLNHLLQVPIRFENQGSQIVYFSNESEF